MTGILSAHLQWTLTNWVLEDTGLTRRPRRPGITLTNQHRSCRVSGPQLEPELLTLGGRTSLCQEEKLEQGLKATPRPHEDPERIWPWFRLPSIVLHPFIDTYLV